ncbi:elongation factor P maturation arginine rhamnosyltransferase EarP [Azoarcus sp. L1K30]|uniref:elongation factor P maturation arginine rhamnosyltransferase EarP n=1 Tax=Azoarcus sp. L1K30 TaxID=2820277 RepID=UPI001B83E694|nr:elongation factor P maturation arginine rhamnosyltransferase EarP [Azoarcus sp. L1K30]MBR0567536.1 elongation factor P maturation arginine rhamnosyltransferase EarP [Azoarcus sp. L1K30]
MTDKPGLFRPDYEIFCQVVDNFGDIGVCWRLARSLVSDHGLSVRLWVDDWAAFSRLCPSLCAATDQAQIEGVDIRRWAEPFAAVEPARVVVEAFACTLPPNHVDAMAAMQTPPVWINLEYLSAEPWVAGCHGLASPHPVLPLTKYFFFPGFDAGCGGLLRESALLAQRDRWRLDVGRDRWLAERGIAAPAAGTRVMSMFAYEQPQLGALLAQWAAGSTPILLLVPEGRVLGDVARAFGEALLEAGAERRMGNLSLAVLPFSDQLGYDQLLWACDLNFVRGEDSFVRAQWAASPFVWHIYAQEDDAHVGKLDAFLQRYGKGLDTGSIAALKAFSHAWNGRGSLAEAWPAFEAAMPGLAAHARKWTEEQAAMTDLASNLTQFCNHIRAVRG